MLASIALRCAACRLACEIRRSLRDDAQTWTVSALPTQSMLGAQLERRGVRVLLMPNEKCPCQRVCDQVRVVVKGVDVHIPLVSRLLLRRDARRRVAYDARQKA